MGAHISHLADAEIAVHVPEEAVQAVGSAEVLRAIGVVGRGADPLFVVQNRRRHAFGGGVAGAGKLARVPAVNRLELADGAIQNQFANAFEVGVGVPLRAVLRGQLGALAEVVGAYGADLVHADAHGLFAVHVHVAIQRPVGDEGVVVIGGADDHGFHVFLVHHAAPVPIGLGFGEDLQGLLGAEVVDVAKGDHVFVAQDVVVSGAAAPNTHKGDIQLVAGGVLPAQRAASEYRQTGSNGGGFQQIASLHKVLSSEGCNGERSITLHRRKQGRAWVCWRETGDRPD